jgi:hypothetical protein
MRRVISNGSSPADQDLPALFDVLTREVLDPRFESYGNFVTPNPCEGVCVGKDAGGRFLYVDGKPFYPGRKAVRFFGNFLRVAHVFQIDTDEPALIKQLTELIRANQATEAYQRARTACGQHLRDTTVGALETDAAVPA